MPRDRHEDPSEEDRSMTPATLRFEPAPETARALRDAFGCFGTGVTIVTADTPEGPIGMTANSFSSVSLDPALVLWSPALSSKRHDGFVKASGFCVHILSRAQLELAKHFAGEGTDFSQVHWSSGPLGAPTLHGCIVEFHCDTHAVHPAGDHSLMLGRVRHVVHHKTDAEGLLFDRGRFGTFAEQ